MRVCATPGCPVLVPAGVRDGRCAEHRRALERARGTRQARGYGATHDALRANLQQRMNQGERFNCWRCNCLIEPNAWQLGHCDDDRNVYHGPEHIACNTATAGRTRCDHPTHRP